MFQTIVLRFDRLAERVDEPSILNARRTDRFARPAVEAKIEMSLHASGQLGLPFGHHADELDAAARTVVLVAGFQVGWAGRRAESAMDTTQQLVVVDPCRQVSGLD